MRKHININEFELSFNYMRKEIANCFCSFTPKARRLNKDLTTILSDINFIKDLSYSSKFDIEELVKQYPVSENITYGVNSYIYDLELILVNLAKYDDKTTRLFDWFEKYATAKNYIIGNSNKIYVAQLEQLTTTVVENSEEENLQAKVIKFNHLL